MPLFSALSEIEVYVEEDLVTARVYYNLPQWRRGEQPPFRAVCPSCRLVDVAPHLGSLERGGWECLLIGLLLLQAQSRLQLGASVRDFMPYVAQCYNILSRLYQRERRMNTPEMVEHARRLFYVLLRLKPIVQAAYRDLSQLASCGSLRHRFYTVLDDGKAALGNAILSLAETLAMHKLVIRKGFSVVVEHPASLKRLIRRGEYALLIGNEPVETGPAARASQLLRLLEGECIEACGMRICMKHSVLNAFIEGVAYNANVELDASLLDFEREPVASRLYAHYIDAILATIKSCSAPEEGRRTHYEHTPSVVEALHGPRVVWRVTRYGFIYTLPSMYNVYSTFEGYKHKPPFLDVLDALCTEDAGLVADLLLFALGLFTHCGKVKILVKSKGRVQTRSLEPPRVQAGGYFGAT